MTYVLLESLLVQVGCSFNFAEVSAGALCVLINLERALSTLWHFSAQKGRCVLLELGSLRLDFELVVAVESGSVFTIDT